MDVSIIIPYWKREKQIQLILAKLADQVPPNFDVEVLICDSNSGGNIDKIVEDAKYCYNNFLVRHIQCENIVSQKRNIGIKNATGDFLFFLDDDCVPDLNYFKNIIFDYKTVGDGVLCGEVRFPDYLVKTSNYYRYRDSRHPSFKSLPYKELDQWSFVSMNMVAKRGDLLESKIFYDERFLGYGCEDHEFPWRLLKSNLKIRQGSFCIDHHEYGGDIAGYRMKIFCTARDGMSVLADVAPGILNSHGKLLLLEKIFSKNKSNLNLMRIGLSLIFNRIFSGVVELFLRKTDGMQIFYFPKMYRYVLLCSYISGIGSRKNSIRKSNIEHGWYD